MSRARTAVLSVLSATTLGLWLGGLVMLFMSVGSLFQTFPRGTAGLGATGIFRRFEIYQLIVGVVAVVTSFTASPRGKARNFAVFLMVAGLVVAAGITFGISPRIDHARLSGQTDTDAFRRLHGLGMAAYLLVTHLVAVAMAAIVISWRVGTSPTGSPGPASQVEPAGSVAGH